MIFRGSLRSARFALSDQGARCAQPGGQVRRDEHGWRASNSLAPRPPESALRQLGREIDRRPASLAIPGSVASSPFNRPRSFSNFRNRRLTSCTAENAEPPGRPRLTGSLRTLLAQSFARDFAVGRRAADHTRRHPSSASRVRCRAR